MNKIYKAVYNRVRQCVVCVSEIQSGYVKSKSDRKSSLVKPKFIVSTLSAAVLMAVSATSLAVPQPRDVLYPIGGVNYDCSSGTTCVPVDAGGESNWNYTFQGLQNNDTLEMKAANQTLYEALAKDGGFGNFINEKITHIRGGDADGVHAFTTLAKSTGSQGYVTNYDGTLVIQGGSARGAKGIYSVADGGAGNIMNSGNSGTLTIEGGSFVFADGINFNATGKDSIAYISNLQGGTLNILGSRAANGINTNAYNGGTGYIENRNTGVLMIQGGTVSGAYGVQYNADSQGEGLIANDDIGTLKILGGTSSGAYGLYVNASGQGSIGRIENRAGGELIISGNYGGGIYQNAVNGGQGTILNEGTNSTLTIQGGDATDVYGIYYNAYGSGSKGTIENTGRGTLTIQGGTDLTNHGINVNASGSGSTGTISNTGTGTLTIQGGTGYGSYGINSNASGSGSNGIINNTGNGTLIIQGGSRSASVAIYSNAYNGGTGIVTNSGDGTLTIQGGTGSQTNGIYYNAYGTGSVGTISNTGTGELTILGEAGYGIYCNAYSGGVGAISNESNGNLKIVGKGANTMYSNAEGSGSIGTISNSGSGSLTIQGGQSYFSYGMYYNAKDGATGIISNEGEGDLTIQGGINNSANGIYYNAYDSGSVGTINNTGSGTLTIQGGMKTSAYGIGTNAAYGSVGTISNESNGNLKILGGYGSGIQYNANGSGSGKVINIGTGMLTILGGTEVNSFGIEINAYNSESGSISNTGSGILTIQGGTGTYAHGISYNAAILYGGSSSTGTISNTGSGTLTIQGGMGQKAYGIEYNSFNGGDGTISNIGIGELTILGGIGQEAYGIEINNGTINNTGNGTLTIQGGTTSAVYGIYYIAYNGGTGTISNSENGTLNIFGNADVNSYGIGYLTYSSSSGLLENAGVMNLNTYGIYKFIIAGTPKSVSVVNKSTGTVNAEAGAIFEQSEVETTVNDPIPITIYTPKEGTSIAEIDSYATKQMAVVTGWKLKNDWYNYSTWEDGGKLIINDVVAGSTEAQTIIDSFQDRFGTGTTIEFTGTEVNTMSLSRNGETEKPDFTIDHVKELIGNGEVKNGSVITSEILTGSGALDNQATFNQSIGFKGVSGFDSLLVNVENFTLLGEQAAMTMALRTTDPRATFKLTDSPVTVDADSTLKLGIADLSATQGYFEDLAMTDSTAALSVENGIFQITNVSGNGQIKVQEKGQLTIANKASAGEVVNNGVLTANTVNTQIGGSAAVATLADGDQNHFETFTNEKGGEANFADVTVAEGANVKNKADATINAGAVVLNGGAAITNFTDGTLNFDSFEMNGTLRNNGQINITGTMALAEGTQTTLAGKVKAGTFSIGRAAEKAQPASFALLSQPTTSAEITGETYSKVLDLAGGDVYIRKDAILVGVELKDSLVNSHVVVDNGGTFAFSYTENQFKDALKEFNVDTEGKALAVLSTDLSFGKTGSLTVGTTEADSTVNLASDALVLLGTDGLHGKAILNGEGSETLYIEKGAELAFVDDALWGNHYIVRDFAEMDDAANLTVKDKDGKVLEAKSNDKGIYVTIGSTDILDKDEDFDLSNIINAIMDGMQDTTSDKADVRYLSQVMGHKDGVKLANDLQNLSAQAGVLSEAWRLTDNAHESIVKHAASDKYANVWVEALAGKGGVDGASTGYGDAAYDADSYGMIFGVDGRIARDINIGLAMHYQKGDLDADSSVTHNDIKNYGVSVYAGKTFDSGLNLIAGVTYAKGDHEFNQTNLGRVTGETDTQIIVGGLRASYPIMLNRLLVTPYAGIEAVYVKEDSFNTSIGGESAFEFGSVSETFGRVPVGVKISAANRYVAGYADLSVVGQFGNRDAEQTVTGVNTRASDSASFDFADSVLGRVKIGAAYQMTPSTTLGVSYGASMGDVRDLSHEFMIDARWRF